MAEKKTLTALVELATVALAFYAQGSGSKADVYLKAYKAATWAAEKCGRFAIAAELKYQREVKL